MKKLIVLMALVAVSASADLTGWNFSGGASLLDQNAVGIANGAATVITTPGLDLSLIVAGGQIQLADILEISSPAFYAASSTVPFGPATGQWGSTAMASDGSVAGLVAYTMVVNRAGITSLSEIVEGDYIGFTGNIGTLSELQPGADPALAPQVFNGGALQTSVEVIPEPATFGLMGIAGLGMFLARKKARR